MVSATPYLNHYYPESVLLHRDSRSHTFQPPRIGLLRRRYQPPLTPKLPDVVPVILLIFPVRTFTGLRVERIFAALARITMTRSAPKDMLPGGRLLAP